MTVQVTRQVSDGLYVPYHQASRSVGNGLVGTLFVDAEAVGDSGGGSVSILLQMRREEFGFPLLWVPTLIAVQDNLATAEVVDMVYTAGGNRRALGPIGEAVVTVDGAAGLNRGQMTNVTLPIEGVALATASIMSADWASNVDTKIYHLHVFGPVYDLQLIARDGYIDDMAAGLR